MMHEITSFTLKYAFNAPDNPPTSAEITIAAKRHTYQGIPNFNAKYKEAPAPTTYWPAAPMLNKPTLYANRTDKEHIKRADVFTIVV